MINVRTFAAQCQELSNIPLLVGACTCLNLTLFTELNGMFHTGSARARARENNTRQPRTRWVPTSYNKTEIQVLQPRSLVYCPSPRLSLSAFYELACSIRPNFIKARKLQHELCLASCSSRSIGGVGLISRSIFCTNSQSNCPERKRASYLSILSCLERNIQTSFKNNSIKRLSNASSFPFHVTFLLSWSTPCVSFLLEEHDHYDKIPRLLR
jgi:hypothetical protein